jgi:hypothetical protein
MVWNSYMWSEQRTRGQTSSLSLAHREPESPAESSSKTLIKPFIEPEPTTKAAQTADQVVALAPLDEDIIMEDADPPD